MSTIKVGVSKSKVMVMIHFIADPFPPIALPNPVFQFRYMNVPMNGEEFNVTRLEMIGRIMTDGLDITVSS